MSVDDRISAYEEPPRRHSDAAHSAQLNETLGHRIASGAAWMILGRLTMRVISFGGTLLLVRLLAPDDFGIVAMASATSSLLDMLSVFSLDLALVQMRSPDRSHFDTVWTLNVLRGAVISIATIVIAPVMATLMREPRVEEVMYVLAVAPLLQGFENVALVNWRRELNFNKVFHLNTLTKFAGLCLIVPTALVLRNYWALIITQIGSSLISVPLGYYLRPYRPKLTLAAWRGLFHFSKWLFVSNILFAFEHYSIVFVISRIFGPATLGLYQVSSDIGQLPASEIAAPIRQPMYAGYARAAHDLVEFRNRVVDGLGIILMVLVPLSAGLAATAYLVTPLFLGPKWEGAAPLITLAAFWGLFDNLVFLANNLFILINKQARCVKIRSITQVGRIALIALLGSYQGVTGVFVALVLTAIIAAVALFGDLFRTLAITWPDVWRRTWRTLIAASAMGMAIMIVADHWTVAQTVPSLALQFGLVCVSGAFIHILCQTLLWFASGQVAGPEREAVDWLKMILANMGFLKILAPAGPSG